MGHVRNDQQPAAAVKALREIDRKHPPQALQRIGAVDASCGSPLGANGARKRRFAVAEDERISRACGGSPPERADQWTIAREMRAPELRPVVC